MPLQRRPHTSTSRVLAAACFATLFFVAATSLAAPPPVVRLPTIPLAAGIHVIQAEVANTDQTRQTGLMHRETMKSNEGMLFVFERPDQQCFWMKNTLLPLSIAFIGDDGIVSNIADMQPQSTDVHCSTGAVRYALEMNQGWFQSRGIGRGNKINGLP